MHTLFRLVLLFTLLLGTLNASALNSHVMGSSNDVDDWYLRNGAVYDSKSFSAGSGSIKLTHTDRNWAKRDYFDMDWNSKIPIQAGKTYTLSMRVYTGQSAKPKLFIFGRYITDNNANNRNDAGKTWSNTKTNEWEYVSHKIVAKPGDKFFYIYVSTTADSPTGPIWLDEIQLTDDAVTNDEPEEEAVASPIAPTNLTSTSATEHSISLAWTDNAHDEDAYLVYRNDAFVAALNPNTVRFIDEGLKPGTPYDYTVKAINSHSLESGINVKLLKVKTAGITGTNSGASNLINNGNFKGTDTWYLKNGATYDTTVSKDGGTGSIKLTTSNRDWSKRDMFYTRWNRQIPVKPGKTYTLSITTKTASGKNPQIFLFGGYRGSDKHWKRNAAGKSWKNTIANTWQTHFIKISPKVGEVFFTPQVTMTSSSGTGPIWIDKMALTEDGLAGTSTRDGGNSSNSSVDSDGDGVSDTTEIELGTNPNVADTSVSIPATATSGKVADAQLVNQIVGTTKGSFSVNQGAANYNIDITVPPGRAGMQPKLSLNYNSNSGDGYLGKGWGIGGLSVISRCPSTKAVDGKIRAVNLDNQDNYCLDGQRLIRIGQTDEYKTEIDNFSKIVAGNHNGYGPGDWTVYTKSGLIYTYGNGNSLISIKKDILTTAKTRSIQGKDDVALSWAVDTIKDRFDNEIIFDYEHVVNTNERMLNKVTYNDGQSEVKFNYIGRTTPILGFYSDSELSLSKKLNDVVVTHNYVQTSRYKFEYEQALKLQLYLLKSIQEYTKTTPLKKLNFEWSKGHNLISEIQTQTYTGTNNIDQVVDLNGDGEADLVSYRHGNVQIIFSGKGETQQQLTANRNVFKDATASSLVDVNGDGYLDLIGYFQKGKYDVFVSYGSPNKEVGDGKTYFSNPRQVRRDLAFWDISSFHAEDIFFTDINGDGKTDILGITHASSRVDKTLLAVSYGTGNSFGSFQRLQDSNNIDIKITHHIDKNTPVYVLDLNQDSTPDIIHFNNHEIEVSYNINGTYKPFVNISNLSNVFVWDGASRWNSKYHVRTFADMNGDGYPDLVAIGDKDVFVSFNTGNNFKKPIIWGNGNAFSQNQEWWNPISHPRMLIDMNGDGLADIVGGRQPYSISVAYNTGHNSFTNIESIVGKSGQNWWTSNSPISIADLDGDGALDIIGKRSNGIDVVKNRKLPKKIVKISNYFDQEIDIKYLPLTEVYSKKGLTSGRNTELTPPMQVVSQVKSWNGIGNAKNSIDYRYAGYVINRDRGSQGFKSITAIDVTSQMITTTSIYQHFPLTGMISDTVTSIGGETISSSFITYENKKIIITT